MQLTRQNYHGISLKSVHILFMHVVIQCIRILHIVCVIGTLGHIYSLLKTIRIGGD